MPQKVFYRYGWKRNIDELPLLFFYYGFTRPSHDELKAEREKSGKAKVLTVNPYTNRHVLISNDAAGSECFRVTYSTTFGFIESIFGRRKRRIFCLPRRVNHPVSMIMTRKEHFIPLMFPSDKSFSFVSENLSRT